MDLKPPNWTCTGEPARRNGPYSLPAFSDLGRLAFMLRSKHRKADGKSTFSTILEFARMPAGRTSTCSSEVSGLRRTHCRQCWKAELAIHEEFGRCDLPQRLGEGSLKKQNRDLSLPPSEEARLVQIVGRHLHLHAVTDGQAHEAFGRVVGDGGGHGMRVVGFDANHGVGQNVLRGTFQFDAFFLYGGWASKKAESGPPELRHECLSGDQ